MYTALCFSAMGAMATTNAYSQTCGDGTLDAAETCDDGNVMTGDGCDAACALECGTEGSVNIGLGFDTDDAIGSYAVRNIPSTPTVPFNQLYTDLNGAGILDMQVTTALGLAGSAILGPFYSNSTAVGNPITVDFFETGTTNPIAVSDFRLTITDIDQALKDDVDPSFQNEGIRSITLTLIDGSTVVYDISLNSTIGANLIYEDINPANGVAMDSIRYSTGAICDNNTMNVPECLAEILIPFPVIKIEWEHGTNTGILTPPSAVTTCTIPVCGNNIVEGAEQCDDGMDGNGDGCTDTCMTETGYACPPAGGNCADINECTTGGDNCGANATCTNTPGSFTCACDTGFTGDGITCTPIPIDECAMDLDNCDLNATCADTATSFTCTCNTGYMGDGVTCDDIDECALGTTTCGANASCNNLPGSSECVCDAGFVGDGITCTPSAMDECTLGTDTCDVNATCTDTATAFTCACNAGYEGDGMTCTDIDECADPAANNCNANATCTNIDGGFTCACNEGFVGDGVTCDVSAVDECAMDLDNCGENATCTDTAEAFTCECNEGFVGDGITCEVSLTDECDLETDNCDDNATCTDTAEGFTCECNDGFTGDGVTCNVPAVDVDDTITLQGGGGCSTSGKSGMAFMFFAFIALMATRRKKRNDLV